MKNSTQIRMKSQQGLALLTVLLVFSIVSVLSVAMLDRQANDVQRSQNLFLMQQSRAFAFAAEQAVRAGLYLDWKQNAAIDHDKEKWNVPRTFPLEPGKAYLSIRDAQGRFNINSMHGSATSKGKQIERFRNLLNLLALDTRLARSVASWLDETSQVDNIYESMEPPYRPSYMPCKSISELLLVENLGRKDFTALEPYISCLPINAALNINTASAIVLASLDPGLSLNDANSLISARGEKGFATVDDFWGQSVLQPYTQPPSRNPDDREPPKPEWEKGSFSVKSEYFEMFARIDLGGRMATTEALIRRDNADGRMTTMYRDYSRREEKSKPSTGGNSNNTVSSTNPAS